ncbi:hypothetical protein JL721_10819 [Aureococcus anophagefferens]|nr:hypothetical protein JL721_10819 [Aureococcus anophagefferens]
MLLLPASPRGRLRPVASCPDLARRAEVPVAHKPGRRRRGLGLWRLAAVGAAVWLAQFAVASRRAYVRFPLALQAEALRWWLGSVLWLSRLTRRGRRRRRSSALPRISVPVVEGTWDEVRAALPAFGDDPPLVVVRGFAAGLLDDFGDAASAATLHLHDAVERMVGGERLYGGFLTDLLAKQPALRAAVTGALARLLEAPALARFGAEVDQSIHHAFVSGGAWHWAQLHNAPVADAFLQVANRKRWYFTVPDYAPFMRPICLGFTAGCRFMMDPRNQSRVPFVEIVTGPGDLLVFPSFWPHAVANLDEGFGFGVGVRPRVARELFAAAAFPATARRSQLSPALNFALRHAYTAATRPAFYRDAVARLSGKFASLSTSLAVNSPELEAVALRAAAAVRLH